MFKMYIPRKNVYDSIFFSKIEVLYSKDRIEHKDENHQSGKQDRTDAGDHSNVANCDQVLRKKHESPDEYNACHLNQTHTELTMYKCHGVFTIGLPMMF